MCASRALKYFQSYNFIYPSVFSFFFSFFFLNISHALIARICTIIQELRDGMKESGSRSGIGARTFEMLRERLVEYQQLDAAQPDPIGHFVQR